MACRQADNPAKPCLRKFVIKNKLNHKITIKLKPIHQPPMINGYTTQKQGRDKWWPL